MIRLEEVSLNCSRVHLEPGNVFELGTFFSKRLRRPNQWWPRHVGGCTSCVPSLDGRGERAGCWRNVETPWGAGLRRLARNFLFSTFFPFLTRLPFRRWCAAGSSKRSSPGAGRFAAAPRAPEAGTLESGGLARSSNKLWCPVSVASRAGEGPEPRDCGICSLRTHSAINPLSRYVLNAC